MDSKALNQLHLIAQAFSKQAAELDSYSWEFAGFTSQKLSQLLHRDIRARETMDWLRKNTRLLPRVRHMHWNIEGNNALEAMGRGTQETQVFYRLSPHYQQKDLEEDDRVEILGVGQLVSQEGIPPLFLIEYQMDYYKKPTPPKLISHYYFITEALSDFFTAINYNQIENFILENKDKIDNLIKLFFSTSHPRLLGKGSDGLAFQVSHKLVLKIFKHETAYRNALEAVERLHRYPELAKTEAMIYDVGILGSLYGKNIYYYVIEKMTPATSFPVEVALDLRNLISEIVLRIEARLDEEWRPLKYSLQTETPQQRQQLQLKVKTGAQDIVNQLVRNEGASRLIDRINSFLDLKSDWVSTLTEELIMKYLTGRTDLHIGNLGLTRFHELRYFDPSFGGYESTFNIG